MLLIREQLNKLKDFKRKIGLLSNNFFLTLSGIVFCLNLPFIDGFHSRDLQSCATQMTKAMTAMLVHITKEVH